MWTFKQQLALKMRVRCGISNVSPFSRLEEWFTSFFFFWKFFLFFEKCWRTSVLLCCYWYSCIGLLVMSALRFKDCVQWILRFISSVTPADLLTASIAAKFFMIPVLVHIQALVGIEPRIEYAIQCLLSVSDPFHLYPSLFCYGSFNHHKLVCYFAPWYM